MQWVRTNRRFGAWCALVAIALQVILSFGHAHRIEGFRPGALLQAAVHAEATLERSEPASKPAGLAFEYCAVCVVIKMGACAVPPEAPSSCARITAGEVRFARHAEAAAWTLAHLLFQARAPPSA
jgi:hypothetical protein